MVVTVAELEKIMIEKCIAIRAMPKEVRGIYEKSNFKRFSKDKKYTSCEIKYLKDFKREMCVVKSIPKGAGKFVIEQAKSNMSDVNFHGIYFDSIEDAVKSIIY